MHSKNAFRNKKIKLRWIIASVIALLTLLGLATVSALSNPSLSVRTPPSRAASGAFRFISMGDTKGGTGTLATLSNQAKGFSPAFLIYPGDLVSSGFSQAPMDKWKAAMSGNSNNGIADITFPVRGNHDSSNPTGWQEFFDVAGMVTRVGGSNYSALTEDLTYSFDYGNSHFVGIDVTGNASGISASQVSWLDSNLTSAEARGITHAFIFFHGPIYYVDSHSGTVPLTLITVLNKHPIVTATFHGHEHVYAYVNMDSSRVPQITHPFAEFVTGNAGAGAYNCAAGRSDYCAAFAGFAVVDVNGGIVTVSIYQSGSSSPAKTVTLTKSGNPVTPQPTSIIQTPGPTASTRPQASPTSIRTPTPRPTSSPNAGPGLEGDVNGDGKVNSLDLAIVVLHYYPDTPPNSPADLNGDGRVNALDIRYVIINYQKSSTL